jgi:surface polysaccharide O-acyltransferase-like enzyme
MTWSHLWFLMYLMVISLLLLPVLVWAARQEPVLQKASRISVFLPAAILGTALFSLGGYWPYLPNLIQDGANLFYFALCFLAGGMMAVWPGYEERLREQKWLLLLMGGLGFWGVEAWGPSALGRVAVGVTAWGLLGFAWAASSWLRPRPTPRWNKIVEGTFPIYVVHHVPLLLLAVAFLPLPLSTALEIVVITASTVGISWLIYSWAIRPCPPLRWMFGLGKMVASSRNPACEATVARGD